MTNTFIAGLRHAAKGLRRDAATSLTAVLILAIAIAATASMFALVRGILLRPLPVRAQERLIVSWKDLPSSGYTHHHFGDREIEAVARDSRLLESVAGLDANGVGRSLIVEGGHASHVRSAFVTGRFFEVLGVDPVLGRALRSDDDVDGAEPAIVITRGLLGEAIRLAGTGVLAGLFFAAVAGRWVSTLLAGVSPLDPATLAGAALLLMAAAVAAAYVPMRRAARVDVAVLRGE